MHLCDAARAFARACAGFVVDVNEGGAVDPLASYSVEFRTYASRGETSNPKNLVEPTAGDTSISFVRSPSQEAEGKRGASAGTDGGKHAPPEQGSKGSAGRSSGKGGAAGGARERGGGRGSKAGSAAGASGRNGFEFNRGSFEQDARDFSASFGGGGARSSGHRQSAHERMERIRRDQRERQQQRQHQQQRRQRQPPPPPPPTPRRDYYAILSVPKDANKRQVKKAYHAAAKRWHPDKNRQAGQENRLAKAERNFKLIARAYEVLSDADTRAAYDAGQDVDDPKFSLMRAQQKEQQRGKYSNVRFEQGPAGKEWDFRAR
uniref:J domain-containing protein n=1 Tax=Calcidiscus leptoporus TaxID=127549 RepID=A0A7S0JC64_9EUKA|mmetsp:Transcript_4907/g.11185  ORF Transcript_4907/g.11185 Transcript_4907/m.11185 type:complete len:319 (+) Transcript_4907:357-1313(+)